MKSYRYLVLIALVLLMAVSVYSLISARSEVVSSYEDRLKTARDYAAIGSTNYAVSYYNAAIEIKSSPELYAEVAEYYKYHGNIRDYTSWCENFLEVYPLSSLSYDKMLEIYYGDENYASCFALMDTARRRGVTSDYIQSVYADIYNEYYLGKYEYADVGTFSCGFCRVMDEDGFWSYVNSNGSQTIIGVLSAAGDYGDPIRAAVTDTTGSQYFIDKYGEKIMGAPSGYTEFGLFSHGRIAARTVDGKYTYLDENFNIPIGFGEYDAAGTFSCGLAPVKENNQWRFLRTDGTYLGDTTYTDVLMDTRDLAFRQNRAFVKDDLGRWAMIDETGARVGSATFEDALPFGNDGPAAVKMDGKWMFVAVDGTTKNVDGYDKLKSFNNGFAAVQKDGLWGFIDTEGNLVIDPAFTEVKEFTDNGSCFVKYQDTWRLLYIYRLNKGE